MTKGSDALGEPLKSVLERLLNVMPSLCPDEEWNEELDAQIEALQVEWTVSGNHEQKIYALAVKAGLHLMNESLDKSHSLSQEIANGTGSCWHGLMHRMEGDYSNAKYWFADAGHHPIYTQLINLVRNYTPLQDLAELEHEALRSKLKVLMTSPVWNPSVFVDAVELQVTLVQDRRADQWLRQIQRFEMLLLLQYCYEKSCGGTLLEDIGQE